MAMTAMKLMGDKAGAVRLLFDLSDQLANCSQDAPAPPLPRAGGRGLHIILCEDTSPFYKSVVSLRY